MEYVKKEDMERSVLVVVTHTLQHSNTPVP